MIASLLIANRGEIACRIIRTARRLGVRTVAVYSEADAKAAHVREADAAVLIGPAPAAQSYLNVETIIAAAKQTGAEAIHPGYGFLSENAAFAQAVIDAGLTWVGPPPDAIRAMGLKDAAKALMAKAGVPVTPGYLSEDQSDERLAAEAAQIGYPVLIKAVAGGGGKGMRKVESPDAFAAALGAARREAKAAFGDERVLLETWVSRPRHIEVQVFGDRHGNVVHLFERDCSLQRRHQKVIEEAPAPGMDAATREAVCAAAVLAAKAVAYEGAGTIEFIADASDGLRADRIWFMEMNTRLQVEHPVTEMVTGLDLVEWQLRVASGQPLPLRQDEIRLSGHAIEARLYAENPSKKFLPSTGPLTHLRLPKDQVRVDTGVAESDLVTPYYDPMIAKLIAHDADRERARRKLVQACASTEVWPVKTNAGFLARCLEHPSFAAGDVHTGLIESSETDLAARPLSPEAIRLLGITYSGAPPVEGLAGFRLNASSVPAILSAVINGEPARLDAAVAGSREPHHLSVLPGDPIVVFEDGETREVRFGSAKAGVAGSAAGDGAVRSPMPGRIVSLEAKPGLKVEKGQPLLTLEAMKMEYVLTAPFAGVVDAVTSVAGAQVDEGAVLVRLAAL